MNSNDENYLNNLITLYKQHLNLQSATFARIDHDDSMVAIVYKLTKSTGESFILKICTRSEDFLREVHFLQHFADVLPVARIVEIVQPETELPGAILMEFFPGTLLKPTDFSVPLAYEIGSLLARIHLNRTEGYGDLTKPHYLTNDPRVYFSSKFEESFAECKNHLPKALIIQCQDYYDAHINLLTSVDGPCIIHRDFRPGNIIVYEGKLQGIIDWASGRTGFAQEDFCPLEHGEWPALPTSKQSFLAGYASIRPVPDYSTMMPLLRLNRVLATIGFTVKSGTWESSHAGLYQMNRQFIEVFFRKLKNEK